MAQIAMYASVNHTCFGETYAAIQATSFHGVRSRWATPKLGLPMQWLPGPTLPSAPLPLRLTLLRLLPLVFIIILIGLCAQNEDGSWHFILSFFSVASLTWFTRINHQMFESHKKKNERRTKKTKQKTFNWGSSVVWVALPFIGRHVVQIWASHAEQLLNSVISFNGRLFPPSRCCCSHTVEPSPARGLVSRVPPRWHAAD